MDGSFVLAGHLGSFYIYIMEEILYNLLTTLKANWTFFKDVRDTEAHLVEDYYQKIHTKIKVYNKGITGAQHRISVKTRKTILWTNFEVYYLRIRDAYPIVEESKNIIRDTFILSDHTAIDLLRSLFIKFLSYRREIDDQMIRQ